MSSDSDSDSDSGDYEIALSDPPQCRICYEESADELLNVQVCACAGALRFICFNCLRREIQETQKFNIATNRVPRCSTCHHPFRFIRYEVGELGQFQNIEYRPPGYVSSDVNSFMQYLAWVSPDTDYIFDGLLLGTFPIIVVLFFIFFWCDTSSWNQSLRYRVIYLGIIIFIFIVCLLAIMSLFYELRSHYRKYRRFERRRKRK